MFSCRACLRRTFSSLLGSSGSPFEGAVLFPLYRNQYSFRDARRKFTTAVVEATEETQAGITHKKEAKKLQWIVRKHLEHLDDPFKIAQHVEQTLRKDRYEEALLLTQTVSKDKQCTVSWNHLIGYLLEKQRLHGAIKLFNEVRTLFLSTVV
jgi:hydroxylamine reductase (hybrid-cluster protein)